MEHFRTILINMHHLINSFRPHQTRESLIALMAQQYEQRLKETEDLELVTTKARETLDRFHNLADPVLESDPAGTETNGHAAVRELVTSHDEIRQRDLHLFEMLSAI